VRFGGVHAMQSNGPQAKLRKYMTKNVVDKLSSESKVEDIHIPPTSPDVTDG